MNEQPKAPLRRAAPPAYRPQPLIDNVKPVFAINKPPKLSAWQHIKPIVSVVTFVLCVVVAASVINAFVFQSYYVEGTSMTPTLRDHDRLIIDKFSRSLAFVQGKPFVPARGEIVILDSTIRDRQGQFEQLIKRAVGLPGERIVIEDGVITAYNEQFPEGLNVDEALNLSLAPAFSVEPIDVRLGDDEIYVVGDNRSPGGSLDSRSFGPVKLKDIQGRLWARIFPLSEVRAF